jgi:hypothetical protein
MSMDDTEWIRFGARLRPAPAVCFVLPDPQRGVR